MTVPPFNEVYDGMAKRTKSEEDMEIESIKGQLTTLNKRMEEVVTILGGNSSYGVKGIRTELNEVKKEVREIRLDVDEMKRSQSFFSLERKSIPTKIGAFILLLGNLIMIFKTFVDLSHGQ